MENFQLHNEFEQENRGDDVHLVSLNFRISFVLRQRIKTAAAQRGVTMTELICEAIRLHIDRSG